MAHPRLETIARITLGDCARVAVGGLRALVLSTWPLALLGIGTVAALGSSPCSLEAGLTGLRLDHLARSVQLSALRTGALPASMDALQAAMGVPTWPADAWGRPIHVISTPATVALISLGADGREGGVGADRDLSAVVVRPDGGGTPAPAAPAPPPG